MLKLVPEAVEIEEQSSGVTPERRRRPVALIKSL